MLLEVRDLAVSYGRVQALTEVSLQVAAGEIVAVIGPNGAGKTTLLRCLAGLLSPRAGHGFLDGKPLTGHPAPPGVPGGLCHVPQGRRLFGELTVTENLLLGAHLRHERQAVQASLEEMLTTFPILGQRAHQRAGTMSGGEQQILAIARALMSKPRLVMLDEPTLGLAPLAVDKVADTVLDIRRRGIAVVLAEQDANMAFGICDRGYVMEIGKIALSGSPDELASSPHVREAYLGA